MKHRIFLYSLFLFFVLTFSYLFIDPGLIYLRPLFTNFSNLHRLPTTILFICMLCMFFIWYGYFLRGIQQGKLQKKEVWTLVGISAGILLFAYPAMLSFDIFNYIATAKVTFFYHENPYLIMPIEFPHDPLLLFMHAANKTALYAPIWILLTGIPFTLGLGIFLLTLFFFKLFIVGFYLLTVFLIWKITQNLWKTCFFALNPLVVIETLISGHNDIVMMSFFCVSSIYLFKKYAGKSGLFLLCSLGIKYATGVLLPLFILAPLKKITQKQFFFLSALLLMGIFFLSSLREEIYPWYAIWFLVPVACIAEDSLLTWVSVAFSGSLLLRYIPFMLSGNYFGITPLLKILFTFLPVVVAICIYLIKKRFIGSKIRIPKTETRNKN